MKKERIYERKLFQSKKLWQKCKKIIPAGSSTLAKSPNRLHFDYSPFYAVSAYGSHFVDIDGNDWLDCEMAMGTVVWGHSRKEINDAIITQVYNGLNFSVPSTLEYDLSQLLLKRYPQYEALKFFKNGTDSVYAAVRASRFLTNKSKSLSVEYHGWLDWCCYTYYKCTPVELGIPNRIKDIHISCYSQNDIWNAIDNYHLELACIVLCPSNYSRDFLAMTIDKCNQLKIMVIFDEVTSGVRFALGGATQKYQLYPDFLCISKGLANGLPLAVSFGLKENILIMERLKISNAHAGENLSLAAAIACEKLLNNVEEWPTWKYPCERIMKEIQQLLANVLVNFKLIGSVGCFQIVNIINESENELFRQALMKYLSLRGIFTKGYIIFCDAHTQEEILFVGDTICNFIKDYPIKVNS